MNLERIKELIFDSEAHIKNLQTYIDDFAECEEKPPHIKNVIEQQEKEKERLKSLEELLWDYSQIKKVGRPSKGVTKKVSITMPVEFWGIIETIMQDNDCSQSEAFKFIVDWYKDS